MPSLKRDLGIDGNWLIKTFGQEYQLSGQKIGQILNELEEYYQDTGEVNPDAYKSKARALLAKSQ